MPDWSRRKLGFCASTKLNNVQPAIKRKIPYHTIHHGNEAGKGESGVCLHGDVERRAQVRHALDIAQLSLVDVVGEQHLLQASHMLVARWLASRVVCALVSVLGCISL